MIRLSSRRNKIKKILEGVEEVKKKQILAEIKLLKIRIILAILTPIGVVIAFTLTNLPKIETFIFKPKFKIELKENFILNHGKIIISKIEDNRIKPVISCPMSDALNWISINYGSYHFSLLHQNEELWSTDFLLNSRESKIITIPEQFNGNIQVFVENRTPNPLPEEMLDLIVNVTGNGYLFVYEFTKDRHYKRIYPNPAISIYHNEITVEKSFRFPDKDGFGIFAGIKEGQETLLFVVTSIKNEEFSDEISNRMTKLILGKASVKKRENNWGVSKIIYSISKP